MSSETFRAGLALRARQLGRAVPASATKRVILHPEAIGIVGIAMAGERTGLWGIGIGKLRRGVPRTAQVGDARDYREQARLWKEMATVLATCGDEPQIVVSNRQSGRLLYESAGRFRYDGDPEIAQAAEVVWWCFARRDLCGSHAVLVLTEVLEAHFAISHDGGPTDDLRQWLAWIGAAGPEDLACRLERRLAEPTDPKTSLAFDEALYPRVERTHEELTIRRAVADSTISPAEKAKLQRTADRQARNRAAAIKSALHPLLAAAWKRLVEASSIVADDPRLGLEGLEHFCEADQDGWAREVRRREAGRAMRRRDSPRAAVMGLAEAEVALGLWQGALCWGDQMARAEALATGDAIAGDVAEVSASGMTMVVSDGPVRARAGDTMVLDAVEGPIDVHVLEVADEAGGVGVSVEWDGMHAIEGESVVLWPARPDYSRRYLGWLAKRLAKRHWIFGDDVPTGPPPVIDEEDGLRRSAAVAALRRL